MRTVNTSLTLSLVAYKLLRHNLLLVSLHLAQSLHSILMNSPPCHCNWPWRCFPEKKNLNREKESNNTNQQGEWSALLKPHPSPEIEIIYSPGPIRGWTRHHCWELQRDQRCCGVPRNGERCDDDECWDKGWTLQRWGIEWDALRVVSPPPIPLSSHYASICLYRNGTERCKKIMYPKQASNTLSSSLSVWIGTRKPLLATISPALLNRLIHWLWWMHWFWHISRQLGFFTGPLRLLGHGRIHTCWWSVCCARQGSEGRRPMYGRRLLLPWEEPILCTHL